MVPTFFPFSEEVKSGERRKREAERTQRDARSYSRTPGAPLPWGRVGAEKGVDPGFTLQSHGWGGEDSDAPITTPGSSTWPPGGRKCPHPLSKEQVETRGLPERDLYLRSGLPEAKVPVATYLSVYDERRMKPCVIQACMVGSGNSLAFFRAKTNSLQRLPRGVWGAS